MNGRILGSVVGVSAMALWFMPWVYVNFMGMNAYQAGNHIGGIAYLLLAAAFAYAVLSWVGQHVPRMIAAAVVFAISLLFLLAAGSDAAWGLYGLVAAGSVGFVLTLRDLRQAKR